MRSGDQAIGGVAMVPVQIRPNPEDPPFVGRVDEMAVIERAFREAASGTARTVLVVAEAGGGKSRLVAEGSLRASGQGAVVLYGGCLPDAPVAYEPFREPLLRLLESAGIATPDEISVVHDLLALSGGQSAGATVPGTPEAFDAVVALLRRASSARTIVLVLEDLHWATPSTLALLAWIVRRAADARLLVLATSRHTRPDLSDSLAAFLTDLHRLAAVNVVELGGLPPGEIALLVAAEVGIDPAVAVELADRLWADTGGNPFLIREICRDRHLREHLRRPSGYPEHVPETVLAIFEGRLRAFPDDERRILEMAAVLGARFPVSLLAAVTDADAATMAALDRATDAGMLVPLPEGLGFGFPHALARQSVLGLASPARLAAAHGRVAEVLEARSGDTLPEVERLAHHNLNAYGRTDRARRYLIRAAELASRSWAYAEAAEHFQRAGELSGTAAERHGLLLQAAECLQSAGDYAEARDLAEGVVTQTADPATRLAAATMVEMEATLLGGDLRAVMLLLDSLRHHPVDLRNPRYLRGLAGLSRGMGQVLDSPDAFRLNETVLTLARKLDDPGTLAGALAAGLPLCFGRPGRTDGCLRAARELTALTRRAGDAQLLGASGFFRCLLGMRAGTMDDVTAGVVDYRLAYDLSGHLWFEYWPEAVEFNLRFMRGDFAGAEQVARRMRDWVLARFGAGVAAHHGIHMFQLRREQGRLAELRDLVTGTEPAAASWAPALLALYTELRMAEPARQVLDAVADEAALRANRHTEYMPTVLAYMVEAALFLQDVATLRRIRPLVAEHSGLNLVSEQFIALSGTADRYLGIIDAATGDADPLPSFDAAADLASRCGFAVDLALTLTARARHLARTRGARPAVLEAIAMARAIAEPIGQARVLRALSTLDHKGATASPIVDCALTARELEVLGLIADGASNREISRRLTISENTAANHVRSILTKTGAANRTQAAMLAVSRGWVSVPSRT